MFSQSREQLKGQNTEQMEEAAEASLELWFGGIDELKTEVMKPNREVGFSNKVNNRSLEGGVRRGRNRLKNMPLEEQKKFYIRNAALGEENFWHSKLNHTSRPLESYRQGQNNIGCSNQISDVLRGND